MGAIKKAIDIFWYSAGHKDHNLAKSMAEEYTSLRAMSESFAQLKERNDKLAQREIGYNAEIERREEVIDRLIIQLRAQAAELDAARTALEQAREVMHDVDDLNTPISDILREAGRKDNTSCQKLKTY